jgi:hypothetical protein
VNSGYGTKKKLVFAMDDTRKKGKYGKCPFFGKEEGARVCTEYRELPVSTIYPAMDGVR